MKRVFPPIELSGRSSWSHFHCVDINATAQKSGLFVDSQKEIDLHNSKRQYIHKYLINFLKLFLKHINYFYIHFVYFSSPLCPLFLSTANLQREKEESETTQDFDHWRRESPQRKRAQVCEATQRLEEAQCVPLVVTVTGLLCRGHIWPLSKSSMPLTRVTFVHIWKQNLSYVFKCIMLYFIFLASRKWSWHMETLAIYVSPETLDHLQFYAWELPVHYCCVYAFLRLCHEQTGWEYCYISYPSTLYPGTHLQSIQELRKEIDINTPVKLMREEKYSNWKSSRIRISYLFYLAVLKFKLESSLKYTPKSLWSKSCFLHFITQNLFTICYAITMMKVPSWIIARHPTFYLHGNLVW